MRRVRTTKDRAKRIDLMYFSRPHWLRNWRFWLAVGVPVLALGWFLTARAGGQKALSSGPLSHSHAAFTSKCALCHVVQASSFFEYAQDKACLSCHDAPVHQASQKFTPTCASCHIEHKGKLRMAATADATCVQCHGNLQTRDGKLLYARSIEKFEGNHPEFAPLRERVADPGGVKLNHNVHLQANLIGPNHTRVQMTCDNCHRVVAVQDTWPYPGALKPATAAADVPEVLRPKYSRAYMAPPKFTETCAGCHLLDFDSRFGAEQVPHDKADVIHDFLTKRFASYIAANPTAVREPVQADRRIPGRACALRVAHNPAEWVTLRVEETEWVLWIKTCKECHTLTQGGALLQDKGCVTPNAAAAPLPEIVKSNITVRWLPHSDFDHRAHRAMKCESCHTKAPASHDTADVLIPSIKTCQQCHRSAGPAKDFAEGRCFECHQYHNWKTEKHTNGVYDLQQLRSDVRPPNPHR
jgi:hypothetical protein